ncbi:hypothetical protein Barb4_02567 [Bacteroidales bacterium Barb4]|nr:hypothetical protein Barb4_02567 [Bacteroidales bacterium Barb4]
MRKAMKKILLFMVLVVGFGQAAEAKSAFVKTNGNDDDPGISWFFAYKTLQKALDDTEVDVIHIANGTFDVNSLAGSQNGRSFNVTRSLTIIGGYGRGETDGEADEETGESEGTVLRSYGFGRVMVIAGENGSFINVTLQSLILTGGNATDDRQTINGIDISGNRGGGIYIVNANVTLADVTVANNVAADGAVHAFGGGICNMNGTLDLDENTQINTNLATTGFGGGYGGGVYNEGTLFVNQASITRNVAVNNLTNTSDGHGGGIENRGILVINAGAEVLENTATFGLGAGKGGAVNNAKIRGTHCTISGGVIERNFAVNNLSNKSTGKGGGVAGFLPSENVEISADAVIQDNIAFNSIGIDEDDNIYMEPLKCYHVIPYGSDSNTGLSWDEPLVTFYAALSLAADGDTILLAKGDYFTTAVGGTYTITKSITIIGDFDFGGGFLSTMFQSYGESRVMIIVGEENSPITVSLRNLTLSGGNADEKDLLINNVLVKKNTGGGIYNVYSHTTLDNVTVQDNTATAGISDSAEGGGIYNESTLLMSRTFVKKNTAVRNPAGTGTGTGGGISNQGILEMVSCEITENTATTGTGDSFGGGISNHGIFEIRSCEITGNTAATGTGDGFGGGISNHGVLEILSGKITKNTAAIGTGNGFGGGISNHGILKVLSGEITQNTAATVTGDGFGGGISNHSILEILSGEITGNTATIGTGNGFGGGISSENGTLNILSAVITGNIATTGIGEGFGGGIYNTGEEGDAARILGGLITENMAISNFYNIHTGKGGGIFDRTAYWDVLAGGVVKNNRGHIVPEISQGDGVYMDRLNRHRIIGRFHASEGMYVDGNVIFTDTLYASVAGLTVADTLILDGAVFMFYGHPVSADNVAVREQSTIIIPEWQTGLDYPILTVRGADAPLLTDKITLIIQGQQYPPDDALLWRPESGLNGLYLQTVTGITLSIVTAEIQLRRDFRVSVSILPNNPIFYNDIQWSMDNPGIVELVSGSGADYVFRALSKGEVTMWVHAGNIGAYAVCMVKVTDGTGNEDIDAGSREAVWQNGALHLWNMEGYRSSVISIAGKVAEYFDVTGTDEYRTLSLPAGIYILTSVRESEKFVTKFAVR